MPERLTRRRIAALLPIMALALAACGTDREVTKPDPVPVTAEAVEAAVITEEDLPEGWTATDGGTPLGSDDVIDEHECDDGLLELEAEESSSAAFTDGAAVLTNTVAYFPGDGGAVENLFEDILDDCEQVVVADAGIAVRTSLLDFGVLSDDVLAIKFEIEPDSGPILETDLILARDGDLVSVFRLDGLRPSDKAVLDAAVRAGLGNLGNLANETYGR